jgi:hypothetical protein
MHELKPISKDAVPRSLEKAERYRLLNEPREAESICRDVLRVDEGNQQAIVLLILALTDQFDKGWRVGVQHAQEWVPKLNGRYEQLYYQGVICERWGKALLDQVEGQVASGHVALTWFERAMDLFEQAEQIRPVGNEDAILRWNTCARIIRRNPQLRPHPADEDPAGLMQDDVPV